MTCSYALGPIMYGVDFAVSFVSPPASLALIGFINLFYAVSPLLERWVSRRADRGTASARLKG